MAMAMAMAISIRSRGGIQVGGTCIHFSGAILIVINFFN